MFGYRHWHLCGGAVSTGARRPKSSTVDDGPDAVVRRERALLGESQPDECTEQRQMQEYARAASPRPRYPALIPGTPQHDAYLRARRADNPHFEMERVARFAAAFGMSPSKAAAAGLISRDERLTFDENVAANAAAQRAATRMACELDAIKRPVRLKRTTNPDGTFSFDFETYDV